MCGIGLPFIMGYSVSLKSSTPSLYAIGWVELLVCVEFETNVEELSSLELRYADLDGCVIPDIR